MDILEVLWWSLGLIIIILAMLPLVLTISIQAMRPQIMDGRVRTSLVLGSGGHTTELLKLMSYLDPDVYSPRTYYIAETDVLGEGKVRDLEGRMGRKRRYEDTGDFKIFRLPRAREVGQSYVLSIPSTLYSLVWCIPLLSKDQPQLVMATGPGTCLPVLFLARLLGPLFSHYTTLVYSESICRVETLSLTARLAKPIVDRLLVQWPELATKYPGTTYIGKFL